MSRVINSPTKAGVNNSRHTNKLRKARQSTNQIERMESQDSNLVNKQI